MDSILIRKDNINKMIQVSSVEAKKGLEIGGTLWGYVYGKTIVVVYVLDGGIDYKQEKYSFNHDGKYIEEMAKYIQKIKINEKKPDHIFHLGAWHSHHYLDLFEPSSGDDSTVRKQFEEYKSLEIFVQIIININKKTKEGKISPFVYSKEGGNVVRKEVNVLDWANKSWEKFLEIGKNRSKYNIMGDHESFYRICDIFTKKTNYPNIFDLMDGMSEQGRRVLIEEAKNISRESTAKAATKSKNRMIIENASYILRLQNRFGI